MSASASNVTLSTFPTAEALVNVALDEWIQDLRALKGAVSAVALPGGRIYRKFFDIATSRFQQEGPLLAGVHFFWGDERCVPPEHEESNYRLAWERFLQPLNIEPDRIHRIRGELKPGKAAEEADNDLSEFFRLHPESGGLVRHLFLGMGEDGHVASLFPGESPEIMEIRTLFRAVIGPKPPPDRVTMGYHVLSSASKAWVLVSGLEKSGALKQSMSRPTTPLGRLIARRIDTRVLADFEVGKQGADLRNGLAELFCFIPSTWG